MRPEWRNAVGLRLEKYGVYVATKVIGETRPATRANLRRTVIPKKIILITDASSSGPRPRARGRRPRLHEIRRPGTLNSRSNSVRVTEPPQRREPPGLPRERRLSI